MNKEIGRRWICFHNHRKISGDGRSMPFITLNLSYKMNNILAKIIPLIVLGLFALMIFYISTRLRIHFNLPSKSIVTISVATILAAAVVSIFWAVKSTSNFIGALSVAGGYILVFSFYLLVFLLLTQLLQSIVKLPILTSGWIAVGLAFTPTIIGAVQASYFEVRELTLRMPKLQNKLDVMVISDVHLGHHRGKDYLEKIVGEANKRNPDIILLAGDLMDAEVALFSEILRPLLDFKAPAYYVSGNHEKAIDEQKAIKLIAENGVRILNNKVADTLGIQLVGLDYMNPDENTFDLHPSDNKQTIKEVLSQMNWEKHKPIILMQHSPVGIKYAKDAGVDLVVAGHTHAGQVFPFTYLARLIYDFNKGLHKSGNTTIFVSQGAGTFVSRMRLGTQNEINLLRLVPER